MNRRLTKRGSVFLAFGLVLAAVAFAAGCAVGGGSRSASDRPAAKAAGPWRAITTAPEPIAAGRTSVWTGSEMIVTGVNPGSDGTYIDSTRVAEAYSPRTNAWRMLPTPPKVEDGCKSAAAWTGTEVLVWNCGLTAYNPATNRWRRLPDAPTRHGIAVWTGHELVGWGGGCCGDVSDDGSAYNPVTNTWRKLSPAPISGQQSPIGAFTGRELVIFNGHGPAGDRVGGAAYNPTTDTWRRIPSQPGIRALRAVYDGNEIYAVGGPRVLAFNPTNDKWRKLPRSAAEADSAAVWTGNRLILTGSATQAYDPPRDLWRAFSDSPLKSRQDAEAVWTGHELIVWGGLVPQASGAPRYLADGAALTPPSYSPPLPQCSC